jgi:replication-associated recombination protein RarA
VLDRLIEAVRREESPGLVLWGEPGVGKTVLLGYLVARASGCRIVRHRSSVGDGAGVRRARVTEGNQRGVDPVL